MYLQLTIFRVCLKCGCEQLISEFRWNSRRCRLCRNAEMREYRANNREIVSETNKRYHEKNRERLLEKNRRYNEENREQRTEYAARYRELNPDLVKEQKRKCYERYAEKNKEYSRKWSKENPEQIRQTRRLYYRKNKHIWIKTNSLRKARKNNAEGFYTHEDVECLHEAQDGKCIYCEIGLEDGYHVDHLVPLSRGGSSWPENLALACPPCNQSKGNKTPEEFVLWREKRT